jgi:hypothetical protein
MTEAVATTGFAAAPRAYRMLAAFACIVSGIGGLLALLGLISYDAAAWSAAPLLLVLGVQCLLWPRFSTAFDPRIVRGFGVVALAIGVSVSAVLLYDLVTGGAVQ